MLRRARFGKEDRRLVPCLLSAVCLLALTPAPAGAQAGSGAALGVSLYEQGRLDEARTVLEQVVDEGRASTRALTVLGMVCTELGDADTARAMLTRARDREPFDPGVLYALGALEFSQGAYARAGEYFRVVLRIDAGSARARAALVATLVNRAAIASGEGDLTAARELLLEAVRLSPGSTTALRSLSVVQADLGELDEAVATLEKAAAIEPGNAQTLADLGTLLLQRGSSAEAEAAYLASESLDTDDPAPYLYLAKRSIEQGDRPDVILTRLHAAIGKAVGRAGALRMQAAAVVQRNEGGLGAREVREVGRLSRLADDPLRTVEEALDLLARVQTQPGALEADLRRLVEWYPHSVEIRIALGHFLESQRRYEEAVTLWTETLVDVPTTAAAHRGLGRSLRSLGRMDEALAAYRRARDLDPEHPEAYEAFGELYARTNREAELARWYGEIYDRERTNVTLVRARARLAESLGSHDEAATLRLRALELEERAEREADQNS